MFFSPEKCIGCKKCRDICPKGCHEFSDNVHIYKRERCVACGSCDTACITDAVRSVGYEKSVSEITDEVLKDKIFYENSGGGITFSGGEPMYQFDFTYELLKSAKKNNLHTCLETCGFSKWENFEEISDLVDIFLFDYKETNPEKHKKFTGVSNELILSNLKMLDEKGNNIILRCPIIPGLNDTKEHFNGIAQTANALKNIREINIEPYHPLGEGKARMLGRDYPLEALTFPDDKTVEKWIKQISSITDVTVKKA